MDFLARKLYTNFGQGETYHSCPELLEMPVMATIFVAVWCL